MEAKLEDLTEWVTVRGIVAETAGRPWSEAQWRWQLFHRKENGLDAAVAKVGGRLLLHRGKVLEWISSQIEKKD